MCIDIDCERILHRIRKLGKWSKALLLLVAVSSIAFAIYTIRPVLSHDRHFGHSQSSNPGNNAQNGLNLAMDDMNDVVIAILSFVVLFFQILHVILGTFYYNLYELVGMLVTQVLITLIVVLPLIRDLTVQLDDYLNVVICTVVVVCQIAFIAFAYPLYKEFSWRFYRVFGSDTAYRLRVRNYMKFIVLLRVDLVLWVSLAIASHHFNDDDFAWEFAIDALALLSSLAFVFVGYFAHKRENYPLLASFWTLALVGPIYLCHVYRDLWHEFMIVLRVFKYHQKWKLDTALTGIFLVSGVLLLAVRITLMVFSIINVRNFGKFRHVKKSRGLVNGEPRYVDVEYEGIDIEYSGSDSDDDIEARLSGQTRKIRDDLTFEDVVRNTYRYTTTPSSNELPDLSSSYY